MSRSPALRTTSSPALREGLSPRTRTRVADQILERLERRGIDRIFGIPGGTISPVFDALLDHGVELVTAQHEAMAVYMATGYAVATGRPGVVAVTSGPGALNAITACAAAHLDGVPLVLLVGEPPTSRFGRSPIQEGNAAGLDLPNMFRSVTRHQEILLHPQRAASLIEHALSTAEGSPAGPVLVMLPVDVAQQSADTAEIDCPSGSPPVPSVATCQRIADLVQGARRPLLLLGRGSRARGVSPLVLELAEYLRCAVATDIEAKGVFPESHPLSLGIFGVGRHGGAHAFLEEGVDVLVTIGCRLDDTSTTGYSELLRPDGALVQIDTDPARLGRSYAADIAVHGDLADTLVRILERCPIPEVDGLVTRDKEIRNARTTPPVRPAPMGDAPHDPRVVPATLQRIWPDAVFTTDIGNHLIFASQGLVVDQPDGFHVSFGLAGMGSGIGSAVGLQLGYGRSRQVISICGDGGMLMVGSELATCARYDIPIIFAVFNDGALGMVQHGMEGLYGRSPSWGSPVVDLVGYARSLGCDAMRIDGIQHLEHAAQHRFRGPLVLDIPVDPAICAANPRVQACSHWQNGTK